MLTLFGYGACRGIASPFSICLKVHISKWEILATHPYLTLLLNLFKFVLYFYEKLYFKGFKVYMLNVVVVCYVFLAKYDV